MVENFSQGESMYFNQDPRIKLRFIDKHYNVSTDRAQRAKNFFKELCKQVFNKNLEICARSDQTFPILYGERNCYSSVGASLHEMGYAHMSEWGIGFREEDSDDKNDEPSYRRVDFWCEKNKEQFWLEFKHLALNIGKNAKIIKSNDVFSAMQNRVHEALDQIFKIKIFENGYKLAIFNMHLWFHKDQEPEENKALLLEKVVDSFMGVEKVRKGKVMFGIMDFSQCYEDYDFFLNDDKVPYILMIGIIYL